MLLNLFLFIFFLMFEGVNAVAIDTPNMDERNEIAINPPYDWGYRTFPGKNGLLGAFWPKNTTFNLTQKAIFVFIQDDNAEPDDVPENINLFTEKCEKANFNFSEKNRDITDSIYETYFSGKCGRTMILLEDSIAQYKIILSVVGATNVTKKQLRDAKEIMHSYKKEIKKQIAKQEKNSSITLQNLDEDDDENENEHDDENENDEDDD